MCVEVRRIGLEVLIPLIEGKIENQEQVNIVIAGIRCSGKTALASKLKEVFSDRYEVAIISQDCYLKNLVEIPKNKKGYLFESWTAFFTSEFVYNIDKLLKDGISSVPIYDFEANSRTNKRTTVKVGKINIFEGLHAISLLNYLKNTIKVFLDTEGYVEPVNEKYILYQKAKADIVLNLGGD